MGRLGAAFRSIHELLEVGGVALHCMPAFAFINHGYYNVHPNVFVDLARVNAYEIADKVATQFGDNLGSALSGGKTPPYYVLICCSSQCARPRRVRDASSSPSARLQESEESDLERMAGGPPPIDIQNDVEPLQPPSAFLTLDPDRSMDSYAFFDFLKLAEG